MISKRTLVDLIEVVASGHVQVRFAVQLVEDGVVIDHKWHRTAVEPGVDVDAQLSLVNANLEGMGKARVVDAAGLNRLKAVVRAVHTDELVAEFRQKARRTGDPK